MTNEPVSFDNRAARLDVVSERLAALLQTARGVNSSLELREVLDHILRRAKALLRAESGSVMLTDPATGRLCVEAAQGPRARSIVGREQPFGEGVSGWVALRRVPVRLHGCAIDSDFRNACKRTDVSDAVCAPLLAGDELLGVICLSNADHGEAFSDDDLDLLVALSNQAAIAIRNAHAFHEMRRQRETVARLLEEITEAQERERARIALLIHDGPAQTLYAALRNLQAARVLSESAPDGVGGIFDELERTIRGAIHETRAVMVDLRPIALDEIGLYAALQQYGQQFQERTGIHCRVVRRGANKRMSSMLESSYYRIAQEALTNVWKHADARNAEVILEVRGGGSSLEVRVDGKGIDSDALRGAGRDQIGLSSLRDRAELVGGVLEVQALPCGGTIVRVSAPLSV
ncbi:MAG: GAF domain-containing protein [Actinomycetota bacterium]